MCVGALLLQCCSTTSNLPEGENLYVGIDEIKVDKRLDTDAENIALTEMEAALAYAPNNALFGSSSLRSPLPIGLWTYNSLAGKELKGVRKWLFNTFATPPRTITSASPDTRSMVATSVLQNYGYFQGNVDYSLVDCKNPRKQKIRYDVHLGNAYTYDSIRYAFTGVQDSIVRAQSAMSFIGKGKQFSVADLQSEKARINTAFHNNGFYYYRPDYILYFADTINHPGKVHLLVAPELNLPEKAMRQYKIGRINAFVRTNPRDTTYENVKEYKRLTYSYQSRYMPLEPKVMFRGFKFWTGRTYSEEAVANSFASLSNMGIFSKVQFSFTPHDDTDTCSVLDVRLDATMDKLIETSMEFNFSQRSNSQMGPDLALTFSKRNAFNYGETFSVKLLGSYYWKMQNRSSKLNSNDSYKFGGEVSLSYPWIVFPGLANRYMRYPAQTKFYTSFTRENVAGAYRFNKFGLGVDYQFQTTPTITHVFSPLNLTLVQTREMTDNYILMMGQYNNLMADLIQDEFTPAMQYKLIYDNSANPLLRTTTHFEASVKESGNIIGGLQTLFGKNMNEEDKTFVFERYSQFVKFNLELRNKFKLSPSSCIATRALAGAIYAYGNSIDIPFSEGFYSGGANSIRAFASRSIGPGNYHDSEFDSYIYHYGAMRLEFNAEYRFRLFGSLHGALFIDAGNVWDLKEPDLGLSDSEKRELQDILGLNLDYQSKFSFSRLFDQLALGTGFGLRYDLDFLVLRFDVGIAIHAPYDTGKSGYYNIRNWWKDGIALHFAVGYPF